MKKIIGYILLVLFFVALGFGFSCVFRYCGGYNWFISIGGTLACFGASGALMLIIRGITNLIWG